MEEDNDSRHNCRVHWVDWNGRKLPKRLGGHPALDFCNTWAGWAETDGGDVLREWLRDYGDLLAWAHYAGLVEAAQVQALTAVADRHPRQAALVLEQARSLRAALYSALVDRSDVDSLAAVTEVARRAGAHAAVVPTADGPARWTVGDDAGLDQPLLAVGWAGAQLLTSPDALAVSACPGAMCGWLFLDRRGRRRWCDMAVCGNRAKVAAHARRARAQAPSRST
jgi:predicted RNA-binding Zn ribbon-like protein